MNLFFSGHGFNKQTPGFYIKDQIKKFIISQVRNNIINLIFINIYA